MTAQPTATRANVAALIPCYFEEKRIRDVAAQTKAQLDHVLVVDDGSTDRTSEEAKAAGVEVIRHEKNAGKGAAIKTGLRALLDRPGVEFILILDGDGQHLPAEIPNFLAGANATGAPMVVGNRMGDVRDMPFVRKCTNRYMSWTISRVIGQRVPDSQCGFRMFSRSLAAEFLATESSGFDFETEMLALAARRGCRIGAAKVSTIYGDEVSKIHPVRDTIRFFNLLDRLKREARMRRG
ncbi:MAG: glycosyltransferase family 2 protein [Chthoniobacteraceae bacterium]